MSPIANIIPMVAGSYLLDLPDISNIIEGIVLLRQKAQSHVENLRLNCNKTDENKRIYHSKSFRGPQHEDIINTWAIASKKLIEFPIKSMQ